MPVIPATREAVAEESLELGSGGCNEPRSCHCTPAWGIRGKLHLKKIKMKVNKTKNYYISTYQYPFRKKSDNVTYNLMKNISITSG